MNIAEAKEMKIFRSLGVKLFWVVDGCTRTCMSGRVRDGEGNTCAAGDFSHQWERLRPKGRENPRTQKGHYALNSDGGSSSMLLYSGVEAPA